MKKLLVAVLVASILTACSGPVESEDGVQRNNYGGVTVYEAGYKSNSSLTVFDSDGEYLCMVWVPSKRLWPDEFDPNRDVFCDRINGLAGTEG